jgi:hypothetical protein
MKQTINISDIKKRYPDEWVLLGNPVMDNSRIEVFSGVPLYHSTDKREACLCGKPFATGYDSIKLVYTGTFVPTRMITSIFKPVSQ